MPGHNHSETINSSACSRPLLLLHFQSSPNLLAGAPLPFFGMADETPITPPRLAHRLVALPGKVHLEAGDFRIPPNPRSRCQ